MCARECICGKRILVRWLSSPYRPVGDMTVDSSLGNICQQFFSSSPVYTLKEVLRRLKFLIVVQSRWTKVLWYFIFKSVYQFVVIRFSAVSWSTNVILNEFNYLLRVQNICWFAGTTITYFLLPEKFSVLEERDEKSAKIWMNYAHFGSVSFHEFNSTCFFFLLIFFPLWPFSSLNIRMVYFFNTPK